MITGHCSSGWGNAYALQPSRRTMTLPSPMVTTPVRDIRFQAEQPLVLTQVRNGLPIGMPEEMPIGYKRKIFEVFEGIDRYYPGLLGKIGENGWHLIIVPAPRETQGVDADAAKKRMRIHARPFNFPPDDDIYEVLAKAINLGASDDGLVQGKGIWPRTFLVSNNPKYIAYLRERADIHPNAYRKQFEGSIVLLFKDPELATHEGPLPGADWIRQILAVNQ